MSKLLKLDATSVSQRYATETAWFDCKRSSHYSVFMLWKKTEHELPELRLFYKGASGKRKRLRIEDMLSQYHKVREGMSLSQARQLFKELKLEVMSSLARYEYILKMRKTKVSHARDENPWQKSSRASDKEFEMVWPRWLTEITKLVVDCFRRAEEELDGYARDDNGKRIRLYGALMDTVREDIVEMCLPTCSKCIECAGCDTPCQEMPLDIVVPLIIKKIEELIVDGTENERETQWLEAAMSCRMFKPVDSGATSKSRLSAY